VQGESYHRPRAAKVMFICNRVRVHRKIRNFAGPKANGGNSGPASANPTVRFTGVSPFRAAHRHYVAACVAVVFSQRNSRSQNQKITLNPLNFMTAIGLDRLRAPTVCRVGLTSPTC
jgi:hypothetical protein